MKQGTLDRDGLTVSALGYGCTGLSQGCGPPTIPNRSPTLRRAIDLGVTFLDTGPSIRHPDMETYRGFR
jgi:aryl-alcohol dehydrogenase-like predicted oxidoreductase